MSATDYESSREESDEDVMDLDSIRGALDELFLLARRYSRSEKFRELLDFISCFKRYSMYNAILVHTQMPGSRYVLPARQWARDFRRWPIEGAQPLVMLQPMGPIMFGFDVAQTEGRALPEGFDNPFEVKGRLTGEQFQLAMKNSARDGIRVNLRPLGSTLAGFVRNAADPDHTVGIDLQSSQGKKIVVDEKEVDLVAEITLNASLSDETNFATLTHELGHLYCGHVGTPNVKWWPDRQNVDLNTREFEAESVSHLVCTRAGLDPPAAEYLNGYLNANDEVPRISLDAVFRAAQRIESMRLKRLPFRQPQSHEVAP